MHFFTAYGLTIQSPLALAEPLACKPRVDVTVRLGAVTHHSVATGPARCEHATPDEVRLVWDGVCASTIKGGREIVVNPCGSVEEKLLSLFISGPAFGVLLHQLGRMPLHASVVGMKNRAVAFLGAKGQGKSTMAAALAARGHAIVADDTLALSLNGAEQFLALPGLPQLRLWPDVVSSLGEDPSALVRIHPGLDKRARPVDTGSLTALPLAGIYLLDEAPTLEIASISPPEAFVELVRHSYALRFLGNAGVTPQHFRQCVRLASSVPAYRLRRPACLHDLPDVAHLVEDHVLGETAPCDIQEATRWGNEITSQCHPI